MSVSASVIGRETERSFKAKRSLEECEEVEGEGGEGVMEVEVEGEGGEGVGKRLRGAAGGREVGGARSGVQSARPPDLNFPLPGQTGLPCLVKVSHVMCHMISCGVT